MIEIYRAGPRLLRTWTMMYFAILLGLAFIGGGAALAWHGQLGGGAALAFPGLALILLALRFASSFVVRIRHDADAKTLNIRTIRPFGGRDTLHPEDAVLAADYPPGSFDFYVPGGISPWAPWLKLRLAGRKAPLRLIAFGHFPSHALAFRLLKLHGGEAPSS